MFERFTDRARRVVVLAQEEARLLNHDYIGTEHILLGLTAEGRGLAAKALETLGVSLDDLRDRVHERLGMGESPPSGHIPFTPRAKKVLELSLREALQLGHGYIGTEHVLLGLVREAKGVGAEILGEAGVDLRSVRDAVVTLLRADPARAVPSAPRKGFTPAGSRILMLARADTGEKPVGSHHYLRAILAIEDSAAARALAAFGVTEQALQDAEIVVAGTSDELPEDVLGQSIQIELEGDVVVFRVRLPERARELGDALGQIGDDPATELERLRGMPSMGPLWAAMNQTLTDAVSSLQLAASRSPSEPSAGIPPPEADDDFPGTD